MPSAFIPQPRKRHILRPPQHVHVHQPVTPLLDVANLHVACAAANTEFVENHHPVFRFGLKRHPLEIDAEGCARLPDGPGLGVEVDESGLSTCQQQLQRDEQQSGGKRGQCVEP